MTAVQILKQYGMKANTQRSKVTEPLVASLGQAVENTVNKSKKQMEKDKIVERASEINKEIRTEKGVSRNDLMLQAKAKGIKNFRILNKEELENVLHPDIKPEAVECIVKNAVVRWKSGFGSRAKKTEAVS
jgi:tRNA G26 N,N-dimethylase Trm1